MTNAHPNSIRTVTGRPTIKRLVQTAVEIVARYNGNVFRTASASIQQTTTPADMVVQIGESDDVRCLRETHQAELCILDHGSPEDVRKSVPMAIPRSATKPS